MNYVTYDDDGALTGGYCQPVHASHQGQHIAVTEEQRLDWFNYRANAARDGVELVDGPSVPAVPVSITPRQGRLVLSQQGLLGQVDAYFASGLEADRIEWEYAQEWRRDWPVLIAAATELGLTSDQIDQMFIAAAAL